MTSSEEESSSKKDSSASSKEEKDSSASSKELAEYLANLPEDKRKEILDGLNVIQTFSSLETAYSGPLPPPKDFGYYDQIRPGSADDIIEMAKTEQKIKADIVDKQFSTINRRITNERQMIWGLNGLGAGMLVLSGYSIYQGNDFVAISGVIATTVFLLLRSILQAIFSRRDDKRD